MGRRAKPAKVKAKAKRPLARKSPKNEDARARDLDKRLAEALKREAEALDQQTATSDILRVISRSQTDVQPVFDTIAQSSVRLCEGVRTLVCTFDGALIHLAAYHNATPEALEAARTDVFPLPPRHELPFARAILNRAVVHVPDIERESGTTPAFLRQARVRSALCAPLLRDGQAIGVIAVSRSEPTPFSAAQIALLQTFADQAVIAIENVRLFKELEERNRDLTTALGRQTATADVLRIIAQSPTELQPVLDAIAAGAMRLCEASDAVIERLEGDRYYNAAHAGAQMKGLVGLPLPLTRRFPGGRAVLDRQRVILDDIHLVAEQEYPDTLELLKLNTIHSVAEIPLLSEGKPLGSLAVLRAEVRPFTDAEVSLLETFADQAVIAIENVRLFTELQTSNRDLTTALDTQTATSDILRVISRSQTDVQPVFAAILDSAVRLLHGSAGVVTRLNGDQIELAAFKSTESVGDESLKARFPTTVSSSETHGGAIRGRVPFMVSDTATDARLSESTRTHQRARGLRSGLIVPMLHHDRSIGTISVARRDPGGFTDDEIALLQTFADQAVIAIENARLLSELQQKNEALTRAHAQVTEALEQQTATSEILRVISSSPTDAQPVFDAIAESARRLCGGDFCNVARYDGGLLHLSAHSHTASEAVDALQRLFPMAPTRATALGRTILERAVVYIRDTAEDPEYPEALAALHRVRSGVGVPMLRDGEPIGSIVVGGRNVRQFTDEQIALLQTFADQAVIAIENVRLFTELQTSNRELTTALDTQTATSDILRVISRSQTDVQPMFDAILTSAVRLLRAYTGLVTRIEDDQIVLAAFTVSGSEGEADAALRTLFPHPLDSEGPHPRAIRDRVPLNIADAPTDSRLSEVGRSHARLRDYRSLIVVPLLRQEEPIGTMVVTRREAGGFADDEIALLETFADQAVIAIENARLLTELHARTRDLEVASQHKSEFLASMSHELRTPLNAIIGFSDVLLQGMFGETNEKQTEYLRDILASGQHLLSLINDILDLSKIEAGRMELDVAAFDLPTAIDDALLLMRERASRRGITLERHVDERLGEIRADQRKVKQVLLNLLSNAVKFTPEGGRIDVHVGFANGTAEISVTDTGIGIAPEDHDAVFEEFRQVGTADKKAEGTGLGLALCRKFVELHGGRIWVKSQTGQGSTFTFAMPLRQ